MLDDGPTWTQDGPCRQVLHVGHEAGKIAAPPVIVGDFLLLPVNDAPSEATIRVFSISPGKEGEPLRPVQTIRVAGLDRYHAGGRGTRRRGRHGAGQLVRPRSK